MSTEERALWSFEFSKDFNGPFLHRSKLIFTMGCNLERTDLGFQASLFTASIDLEGPPESGMEGFWLSAAEHTGLWGTKWILKAVTSSVNQFIHELII